MKVEERTRDIVYQVVGAGLVALVVATAAIRDTSSDPAQSLLVSQSIIEHGTIALDAYAGDVELVKLTPGYSQKFNYFPLGTPVLSVPFVAVLRALGLDMRYDEARAQILIVTLICPILFLVLYRMGRELVSVEAAFAITTITFLGSSLISTLGTALWSHVYTALFITSALFLIVRSEVRGPGHLNPYALGALLFGAFFCRPSAAAAIAAILVYLAVRDRAAFMRTAATAAALLLAFIVFSLHRFDLLLPPYYLPGRLSSPNWGRSMYGLLMSPSRGVLIASPFVAVVLAGTVLRGRRVLRDGLSLLALGVIVLYLSAIAKFPYWDGSSSFGTRYQSDFFAAYVLLAFLLWRDKGTLPGGLRTVRAGAALFLCAGLFAVWVNSWQGLHNIWTQKWNGTPYLAIDDNGLVNDRIMFSWRYSQLFASGEQLRNLMMEYFGPDKFDISIDEEEHRLTLTPRKAGTPSGPPVAPPGSGYEKLQGS